MIKAVDMRKGMAVIHEGEIHTVHECQHVAKGNKRSYMQASLKSLLSGSILNIRFRVDDTLEQPFIEKKEYEFLYQQGDQLVLMDTTTYDQINVEKDLFGDQIGYLKPNQRVSAEIHEGRIISVALPNVVELEVTDTPPVVKGATATNQNKDATLETGIVVKVPPFIAIGETLRIDTRSGEYLERAK